MNLFSSFSLFTLFHDGLLSLSFFLVIKLRCDSIFFDVFFGALTDRGKVEFVNGFIHPLP